MAPRASWTGYLKLSLVSCPVRLYPATSSSERISFNQLHRKTHNRINMKPVDPELGLVERSDLVKGYEYEDKQYVIIDDSDLEAVRIESNHTMNIEAFVDEGEVDVIYQDSPYYLAPDGAMAEETFTVLREAMRKAGNEPEWVVYAEEAHSWRKTATRADFARRMEAFLARHLKP